MREVGFSASLDFYVDVDPARFSIVEGDLHESVGVAFSQFGITHNLAQFGVLEFVAAGPVDLCMGGGEVVGHEFGKCVFQHFFPRAVVRVGERGRRLGGCLRRGGHGGLAVPHGAT